MYAVPSSRVVPGSVRASPAVALKAVSLSYQQGAQKVTVIDKLSLTVSTGKFVAIVGPSGCGKSSLLHLISGILRPDEGEVSLFERPLQGLATGTGYVFQTDALLHWKTVADNIALPLVVQRRPASEVKDQVHDWLKRTGLAPFANAYPSQLSGGMRKRVALAQALVHHPTVALMDEPLSALDVQTRLLIGNELLALWAKLQNTVILVTHDLEEAIGLADEVVVVSARPSRVKATYTVNLPRPRDLSEIRLRSEFQELYTEIWASLREEVLMAHAQQG